MAAVFVIPDDDGWLVVAREHAWLFGSRYAALSEASRMSQNLGLPVRHRGKS
jgi:hypothetical protein